MVRIKYRYLLVHILSPEVEDPSAPKSKDIPALVEFHRPSPSTLTSRLFAELIKDQVSLLYGDYGLGLISNGLKIHYLSPATSTAIVRCSRDNFRLIWAALSFVTQLPAIGREKPRGCVMRVVRASGTIKKAEEDAIRRARVAILKAKGESGTDMLMDVLGEGDDDGLGDMTMGSVVSDEEDGETDGVEND